MRQIALLILLIPVALSAQNLVRNGSFESTSGGAGNYVAATKYWVRPPNDYGTPDDFIDSSSINCFPCTCLENDNCFAGNTYAHHGKRFLGLLGYYIQGGQINGRENIQTELLQPLKAKHEYQIGFALKFGERSQYYIDHFGLYLSDSAVGPSNTFPSMDLIQVQPQLDIGSSMADSSSWTVLSTRYIAKGGEKFLTIGNFFPDSLLTISNNPKYDTANQGCLLTDYGAYYFVDHVFVYDSAGSVSTPSINIPKEEIFTISPNPASSLLRVTSRKNLEDATIMIYNTRGQVVYVMNSVFENKVVIDIKRLNEGMYYLQISQGGMLVHSSKLLIKH